MRTVAIIGAGMAGLTAASRLHARGFGVTLFDKSRGFGGRMATRRAGDFQFDHGAQYFTARGADFFRQVTTWQEQGLVAEWCPGSYVGTPGMTAPARAMAEGFTCITGADVSDLERGPKGWRVEDENGLIAAPGNGSYDALISAIPAPQAIPLARSAGIDMPELAQARYAPCIALMLAFEPETRGGEDWLRPDDSTIAWIARNASKPGRPNNAQTWVVHARPDWSRLHLNDDPQALIEPLLAHFRALTGIHAEPLYATAHRWRYALVEEAVGQPCLFDRTQLFGACGDWCLGARVEAAFDSGAAMADALVNAFTAVNA